jgi:hypothetical protein
MARIKGLSRQELLKLIEMYAKNWLAHDGYWFLAAEEMYGMDVAIELDKKSWERFAVTEARRIMKAFTIESGGGLKALERAFQYRLYAAINSQKIAWMDEKTMIFKMIECRVQKTQRQKNLPDFPCKSVGLVEFEQFAKTMDSRTSQAVLAVHRIRLENSIVPGNLH